MYGVVHNQQHDLPSRNHRAGFRDSLSFSFSFSISFSRALLYQTLFSASPEANILFRPQQTRPRERIPFVTRYIYIYVSKQSYFVRPVFEYTYRSTTACSATMLFLRFSGNDYTLLLRLECAQPASLSLKHTPLSLFLSVGKKASLLHPNPDAPPETIKNTNKRIVFHGTNNNIHVRVNIQVE